MSRQIEMDEEETLNYIEWVDDFTARLLAGKQECLDHLYKTGKYTKKGVLRKKYQK